MSEDETRILGPEPPDEGATVLRDANGEAADSAQGSPADIRPGTLLVNTYRVERPLGGGGMGEVYLATHTGLGTHHAIKVIRTAMAADRMVMDLFYREARVLRGVRHEAVVSYDGFVRDDRGRDYLVMEYAEGPSLADRMRRGPLAPADVLALRDRLAGGLAEAHRKGAVHRDLSPDNVILPGDRIDSAKIIDFGVCKLTDPAQGTILGSSFAGKYKYASPEQLGLFGGQVDARSDIYSLGQVLAAAALGRALPIGESLDAILKSRAQVPDLSGVPEVLRPWLTAMLQPDPADRPATLDELLARWPAGVQARPEAEAGRAPEAGPPGQGASARRRPGFLAGAAVAVAIVAGVLYWLLKPLPAPPPAQHRAIEPSGSIGSGGGPASGGQTQKGPQTTGPVESPPQPPGPTKTGPAETGPAGNPDLPALIGSGRLDEAFALAKNGFDSGAPPATEDSWALAQALLAGARLDQGFALVRELAKGGYGPAAFALAEMYDPLHWSKTRSPFAKPNGERAREWYSKAAKLGVSDAQARLDALDKQGVQ